MRPVYYNENNPFAAAWLLELIAAGLIPGGIVDSRSILEVRPDDVEGFAEAHFFAGIGGWAHALRLAAWPRGRPVWTASCPCQPLSGPGLRKGHADERHLWPAFYALVDQRRPAVIFGEQVASPLGNEWLAGIRADLEAIRYAVGAANLPACSVGAPHRRYRNFWVGDAQGAGLAQRTGKPGNPAQDRRTPAGEGPEQAGGWRQTAAVLCADGKRRRVPADAAGQPQPALWPLADGFPNRVGILRGAGNAIVPQIAAEFIKAYLETEKEKSYA